MVLGLGQLKVVEYRDNLGRSNVSRTQTVATANDERTVLYVIECALDIEIQRFTLSSRFLGTVEHGDTLAALWYGSEEVLYRERTIEVNAHHTHLLALLEQMVDSLAGSLSGRTHEDDNVLGILSSIIVEEVILTTCDLRDLAEVVLNNLGHLVVVLVASLTMCEEGLGVLGCTAGNRTLRRKSTVAEGLDICGVNKRTDVLLVHNLNLVILVRGAESVEEVHEGHPSLKSSEVRHSCEVHNLLYRTRAEHGKTGLAASHNVHVVTEDTERVRSQGTCRHVEHARQQLTCNLVHVRNHEQQTLRCCEGGGESTSLQRTVNGTGGTAL